MRIFERDTPTSAGPRPRQVWIDAVKGITILLVVLNHTIAGFRFDPDFPEWINQMTQALVPVRMPLFFLVAGFFARKALTVPLDVFMRGKVLYFLYFYVLWSVIIFAFRYSLNGVTNTTTYWYEILMIGWDPLPTIWFLYALMISFVAVRLLRNVPPLYLIGFGVLLQAMHLLAIIPQGSQLVDGLTRLFLYFVVGLYCSDWIRNRAEAISLRGVLLAAVCFVALSVVNTRLDYPVPPVMFIALSALAITAVLGAVAMSVRAGYLTWLGAVGQLSLIIYLTHFLPAAGVRIVFAKLLGVTNPYIVIPVAVLCAVVLAHGFRRCVTGTRLIWLIEMPKLPFLSRIIAPSTGVEQR